MSELRKSNTDYCYFLTLTVAGWIDVFTRKEYCDIIIDSLKFCQENKGLEVYAYVIMPSHIQIIARDDKGKLNEIIRDFKSYTAKKILNEIEFGGYESRKEWLLKLFNYFAGITKQNKNYLFWQKTNYPIELYSTSVFDQKIEYIHMNPVVAGIVDSQENYVYSSAYYQQKIEMIRA